MHAAGCHLVIFFCVIERGHHIEHIANGNLREDAVSQFGQVVRGRLSFIDTEPALGNAESSRN